MSYLQEDLRRSKCHCKKQFKLLFGYPSQKKKKEECRVEEGLQRQPGETLV